MHLDLPTVSCRYRYAFNPSAKTRALWKITRIRQIDTVLKHVLIFSYAYPNSMNACKCSVTLQPTWDYRSALILHMVIILAHMHKRCNCSCDWCSKRSSSFRSGYVADSFLDVRKGESGSIFGPSRIVGCYIFIISDRILPSIPVAVLQALDVAVCLRSQPQRYHS